MNLGTTIVTSVLIVICASPFIVLGISKIKHHKQQLKLLTQLAKNHNSSISQYNIIGSAIIGLDTTSNQLFFLKNNVTIKQTEHIDLSNVKSCHVVKANINVKTTNKSFSELGKLGIEFIPKSKTQSNQVLEMYNYEENPQMSNEIELTNKWVTLINSGISSSKKR